MKVSAWLRLIPVTLLFAGAAVWRVLWFPYQEDKLQAAIPPGALLVTEHDALAARWPMFRTHPLVRGVALALGARPAEVQRLSAAPAVQELLDRFASRRTLLAYAPQLGRDGSPGWVVVSWAGVEGQFLRWGFYDRVLPGLHRHTLPGGRRGWVYRNLPGGTNAGPRPLLSVAVVEGILIACLSPDPDAVSSLVRRVEWRAPGWGGQWPLPPEGRDGQPAARDRFCIRNLSDAGAGYDGAWTGSLALEAGSRAALDMQGPAAWGGGEPGAAPFPPAGLLGAMPGVLLRGPMGLLDLPATNTPAGSALAIVTRALRPLAPAGSGPVVCLGRPEYNGRIMGLNVATLLVALPVVDPEAVEPAIGNALDAFNREKGTTLIRRLAPELGAKGLYIIESVRQGPLSGMAPGERPAYALADNWLLIGSNGSTLARLLREAGSTPEPAWALDLAGNEGTIALWADLPAAGAALSKIAAVQDLWAIAQGRGRESTPTRRRLALVQSWINHLAGPYTLCVRAEAVNGTCRIRGNLGPSAQKDL